MRIELSKLKSHVALIPYKTKQKPLNQKQWLANQTYNPNNTSRHNKPNRMFKAKMLSRCSCKWCSSKWLCWHSNKLCYHKWI